MWLTSEENRSMMNINTEHTERVSLVDMRGERRSKPRIYDPFPVTVQGVDASGEAFKFKTVIDNLSAGGLYLRLTRCVEQGMMLSASIRLSTAPAHEMPAPHVTMHGVVLRTELKPSGACGVALAFTCHQFL